MHHDQSPRITKAGGKRPWSLISRHTKDEIREGIINYVWIWKIMFSRKFPVIPFLNPRLVSLYYGCVNLDGSYLLSFGVLLAAMSPLIREVLSWGQNIYIGARNVLHCVFRPKVNNKFNSGFYLKRIQYILVQYSLLRIRSGYIPGWRPPIREAPWWPL